MCARHPTGLHLVLGMMVLVPSCGVWALDLDVALQMRQRQTEVEPFCLDLQMQQSPPSTHQLYQKALCLLYGLHEPEQRDSALIALRGLAESMVDAQLALADALHEGTLEQQQEALRWYARAAQSGDVRASVRHARLLHRIQAAQTPSTTAPAPATKPSLDPLSDPFAGSSALPPNYHCHYYSITRRVCHSNTVD